MDVIGACCIWSMGSRFTHFCLCGLNCQERGSLVHGMVALFIACFDYQPTVHSEQA
jgi:hypothetical protein